MAFAETQKLVVQLDLKGNLNAGLGSAARALQSFDRSTSRTQRSLSQFGRNIERGIAVGAAAATAGIVGVVRAAADYESAFAGVRKTVQATEPELKQLSDQFRALSKEIPISASELARLGEAGGALGVPTKDLKEFVRVTALLGVTTNLTADEAADSLGVLGNVLHLTGDEYGKFASALVALGNAGASTERDIIHIAERAGAAGELIGVSTAQILGFSSAVASLGIEAEAGGTAVQKFFIDSAKFVAQGGDELKIFAKTTGQTTKEFARAFKNDAGGALEDFLAALGKLPQAKQLAILEDLGFNDARITRTLLGLANNTKLVSDSIKTATESIKDQSAITKEAEARFATFDSQVQITKNVLSDMAITIGSKLLPKITPLLKRLNEFVGANQAGIEKFGDDLAKGFENVANALGKVDWTPFIDGLRLSADIAKTVISAFRSLPADLQKLVIAGVALNKVTGGLGTSIAKDIGGAIIHQFAQRGSSPANPLFVADVSGGLGKGIGAAAAGGAAAAALPIAVIAASIVGPIVAQQKISSNLQIQAFNDVTTNVQRQIASGASLADLQKSLAAVDSGIHEIESNPLNVIVGGQALDELKKNRSAIQQQIDAVKLAGRDTVGGIEHLADVQASELGARRAEAAENRAMLAGLPNEFFRAIKGIREARQPENVLAAVKAGLAQISKGRGSLDSTKALIAAIRGQLKNVHDPKLRATLKAAIAKVEARLPARTFAAKQLAKADALIRDGKITNRDLKDLKAIERALKDRGLPHAASRIREKIDDAKRRQVEASRATTRAINAKRWHFTNNVTVNTDISIRNQIRREHQVSRVSSAAVAS